MMEISPFCCMCLPQLIFQGVAGYPCPVSFWYEVSSFPIPQPVSVAEISGLIQFYTSPPRILRFMASVHPSPYPVLLYFSYTFFFLLQPNPFKKSYQILIAYFYTEESSDFSTFSKSSYFLGQG